MRDAITRRPAASSLAMTGPITFLATASGLMIENVRSMAMSDSLEAGSYPRGAAASMRHRGVDVAVDRVGPEVGPRGHRRRLAGDLRREDLREDGLLRRR